MIHLGNTDDGKRFEIPVHHTGIFGQTGVGKTRELKYMARQAVDQGFAVLIIDSKIPHPEFKGFGIDIPLYLEESTDADVFRSLIEGMRTEGRGDMNRYRGGFIELCEPADEQPAENFKHVGARLEAKLHDKAIKGNTRVMYAEIRRDFKKLMDMIGNHQFSKRLEIPRPIARMETRVLPNVALQGLIVKSVIDQVLRQEKDLIILIDEAPNFCHQKIYNPAKRALMALDAQGRSKGIFGWYSGQTLTGFDKANMKNLWYWVIGREMEVNEAKDAHAVQTFKRLTVDEIRRLPVQEFVAVSPEATDKIRVPDVDVNGFLENGHGTPPQTHQKGNPELDEPAQAKLREEDNRMSDLLASNLRAEIKRRDEEIEIYKTTIAELTADSKAKDVLLEQYRKEITQATQLMRAFEGLRTYIDERIKDMAPTISYRGDKDSITINEMTVDIKVRDVKEPVNFEPGSIESNVCILQADGFFATGRNLKDIHVEYARHWPMKKNDHPDDTKHSADWRKKQLLPILEMLSQRRYQVLRKDGEVWLEGTNKVEKEEA